MSPPLHPRARSGSGGEEDNFLVFNPGLSLMSLMTLMTRLAWR